MNIFIFFFVFYIFFLRMVVKNDLTLNKKKIATLKRNERGKKDPPRLLLFLTKNLFFSLFFSLTGRARDKLFFLSLAESRSRPKRGTFWFFCARTGEVFPWLTGRARGDDVYNCDTFD